MQITPGTTSAADEADAMLTITMVHTIDQVVVTLAGELDFPVERDVIGTVSAAA